MTAKLKPPAEVSDPYSLEWARPDDVNRVLPKKGTLNRRLILDTDHTEGGKTYNWMFHATKGWRRRRVYGA